MPTETTPLIPGSEWRVHDRERPLPPVVQPGAEDRQAPSDAIVLFDGSSLEEWESVREPGEPAGWELLEDGSMRVVPKSGNIRSKRAFGSCQLHIEWAAPEEIVGEGQGRGNSGVFLMQRYEIQVLDSFENPSYADGIAAAIYGQRPPLVNACRGPGEWQSYDVFWTAPVFDGDELREPARLTLLHNGVLVQHETVLTGPTTHKDVEPYQPHPARAPLMLQDHKDLVRFRNIWLRELG